MAIKATVVAKLFISNKQGQLLLLRRSADDVRRPHQWDIPGGHVDGDESFEAAAYREAGEEAGLQLATSTLATTRTRLVEPGHVVNWLFFVAHSDQSTVTISHEHEAYRWTTPAEALNLLTYDIQHEALAFILEAGFLTP